MTLEEAYKQEPVYILEEVYEEGSRLPKSGIPVIKHNSRWGQGYEYIEEEGRCPHCNYMFYYHNDVKMLHKDRAMNYCPICGLKMLWDKVQCRKDCD